MSSAIEIGRRGEDAAEEWLRSHEYLIVERNWRSGHHEIDIIAMREDRIHFVEVKSRKAGSLTSPEQAMTRNKCKFLISAANHYISLHSIVQEVQIDLITVIIAPDGEMALEFIPEAANIHW